MLGTHLLNFSTHLPTNRHKIGWLTAVGRCVLKFSPTVGRIPPANTNSNVESAIGANPVGIRLGYIQCWLWWIGVYPMTSRLMCVFSLS